MAKQKESLTRQVASQYIDDTVIDFDRKLEVIGLSEPWLLTANAADLTADKNSFYRASLTYKAEGVARLNDVGMAELLDKCRTLSNLYNLSVHIPQGDLIVQKEALSNDHVTVFRRKMFEIACQRLDANRAELDAMQARYEAYFGKSKGSQRNDTCFEQLRNAIDKDKELQRRDETLCVEQGDAFDKLKNVPDYQPFIDNLQTIKDFRSDIAHSRYLIRKAFPELESVSGERISYKTNNAQILEKMIKSFDRARKAQDEVRAKIDSGDMPLYKLDPIVEAALSFYGITDKSTDDFGKTVNAWLASERSKDCVIKILSTVVSLGLAAACFIPGIGVGAIIALGAIGAGVGMAGAIYEFEMADDLNDAGESQRSGSSKIIADADAARKEYVWGIVNICLASVDLFLSGAEVIRVGKVLSKFDTAADGARFLNSVGNAKDTMTFLNRMDSLPNGRQVIQKLDKATGDTANEVVRFFNGLDEAELSRGVGVFNKYDTADDFVANGVKTGKAKQAVSETKNTINDFGNKVSKGDNVDKTVKNIPRNNGKWKGDPGYSTWIPETSFVPKKFNPDNLTWGKICDKYKIKEIPFKNGEPDFTAISKGKVDVQTFSAKRYGKDGNFSAADELLAKKRGCTKREVTDWRSKNNYTWHEQQNCKTMQKVPLEIHANISHNGGISIINKQGSSIYDE